MSKGEQTKQRIIARAAPVFNTRGYAGTSMGELTHATGLEKGGIYNHFASKEALALASFDYAVALISARFAETLAGKDAAIERLLAIVAVFESQVDTPPLAGGCPVLNTAIEADDTSPTLRARAQEAMAAWHKLIGSNVKRGVQRGELRPEANPYEVASLVTATLEGALMLSRLFDDPAHVRRAAAHVQGYLHSLEVPPGTAGTDRAHP